LTVEEPRLEPAELGDLVEPLRDRELEVLRLIAAGLSNREIAETLVIALSIAKNHVRNVYGKLDFHSRTQAVVRATSWAPMDRTGCG
jgi:ATP/maltotriose-dependent transcriptional regulator MalT